MLMEYYHTTIYFATAAIFVLLNDLLPAGYNLNTLHNTVADNSVCLTVQLEFNILT